MDKTAFKPLLLAAALLACTPVVQAASTLVYCSEASPAGFDPSQYTSGTDFDASAETVFNRLTQFERGSTEIEPGLATRWEVASDGLSYTFHLRENVKFHTTDYFTPTRDFNADDVLFTFDRLLDPDHPFRKAYPSESPYFNDMGLNTTIKSVDKVDEHAVRFSLNNVDAAFIQNLAMSFASIQSAEYAAQLLKEAGIAPGTEINLWAMTVQRASNPNARMSAQMIQADWAKIGIKANIVSYEWGEYIKRAKNGEHDVMIYGWTGDNGDPDNWLGVLYSCAAVNGSNFAKWCDPAYDKLVQQANLTSDRAERIRLYQQAQHILKEQVPITPIANSKVFQPLRKEVQSFKLSPFGLTPFYGVSLKK